MNCRQILEKIILVSYSMVFTRIIFDLPCKLAQGASKRKCNLLQWQNLYKNEIPGTRIPGKIHYAHAQRFFILFLNLFFLQWFAKGRSHIKGKKPQLIVSFELQSLKSNQSNQISPKQVINMKLAVVVFASLCLTVRHTQKM